MERRLGDDNKKRITDRSREIWSRKPEERRQVDLGTIEPLRLKDIREAHEAVDISGEGIGLTYQEFARKAIKDIKEGKPDEGIVWLRSSLLQLENDLPKQARMIEAVASCLLRYPNRTSYRELAANLYENWLQPIYYYKLDMPESAQASKLKAFDIKHEIAMEKDINVLIQFYINEGHDSMIKELVESKEITAINKDNIDKTLSALHLAAEHFSDKDPFITSRCYWKMGETAYSMVETGSKRDDDYFFDKAVKYFRDSMSYAKKHSPKLADELKSRLEEKGLYREGLFESLLSTVSKKLPRPID